MKLLDGMDSLLKRCLVTSQVVKPVVETIVWSSRQILFGEFIVVSISSNLLGILYTCWCLNWSSKTVIVVALVVSELLNFLLGHIRSVCYDWIVNWKSSGSLWVVVWNHVEIKQPITISFNYTLINESSRWGITNISIYLFEESCGYFLVNKDIDKLWVEIWWERLNSLSELSTRTFSLKSLFSHNWTSNSVSVYNNLRWLLTLVLFDVEIKCFF